MTQEEEQLVQQKLNKIIEKLGISEQEFTQNTMFHGQDQFKGMQLMQVQQQTIGAAAEEQAPLTKQKTMETFKVQLDIQMESMDKMMEGGAMQGGGDQMQMMMKMMIQQAKAQDELFLKTGVEEELLNISVQKNNLQNDPEFTMLVQQNMQKVMAKAGGPGGMGGGMGGGMPF